MARRNDHSREELEKLVLDSAYSLLSRKGREALTARNVAAKAGYVPGTIYNLFGSMEGLILHINARTLDSLYIVLSDISPRGKKSVSAGLADMAASYRDFVDKNKNAWLLMFDSSLPEERSQMTWYQEKIDRLFLLLEDIIAPAFPGNKARERQIAARVFWSSFHGLCYLNEKGQFHTVGRNMSVAEMTDFMIGKFMAGIMNG